VIALGPVSTWLSLMGRPIGRDFGALGEARFLRRDQNDPMGHMRDKSAPAVGDDTVRPSGIRPWPGTRRCAMAGDSGMAPELDSDGVRLAQSRTT